MQINNVVNLQNIPRQQNFKGSSANSSPFNDFPCYQSIPLNASKAYASPQISKGYKELQIFNLPYLGEGKLYELNNGHKIILVPKMGQTIIHTYVGVGENNEQANLKESSHLLEHLVSSYCTSSKNNETKSSLDRISAECNAHTDECFTSYYINAAITNTKDFEDLVKIQAKTLQNKDFTDEQLKNEKNTIIQELDSTGKFTANYILADRLAKQNLFNLKDSDDIITPRSISTINNIKKDDLTNYYNTFYRPDNMVTTIIGNVDDNSINTIAKYFNTKKQAQILTQNIISPKIPIDNPIQKTIRKDVQSLDKNDDKAYIDLAFIGPKNNDNEENALIEALNCTINERIKAYSNNNEQKLDISSSSDEISSDKSSPSILRLEGNSYDEDVEDNLKTIYSILYDLTQKPISEEELKIVKDKIKSDWTYFAEDSFFLSIVLSKQGMLAQNLDREKELKMIDSITVQDLQNIAKKYLNLNKASLVVVHPQEKNGNTEKTNAVSFKGNVNQLDNKDIHEYVLPNNLRVVIDSRPGIARSTVKLDLNSKKMLYTNPEAAWYLASSLISKETRQNAERLGISLDANGNSQHICTTLNGSADRTINMLEYAVGTLLNPNLNEKDFSETKQLLIEYNNPKEKTAQKRMGEEFFKENPYYYKGGDIKSLELDDVKTLHQQILKNAQGTVFITIPQEELYENQNEIFKTLMKIPVLQTYDYKTIFDKYKSLPLEKNKIFIEENDSNQIEIRKQFKIIESGNVKDKAGLLLLNFILGGDEQSKLFDKLRNKDNIVYGAYSSFNKDYTPDLASINLSTTVSANNKDNLQKVISEFDKSINELISMPVNQDELNRAKIKIKNDLLKSLEKSKDRNDVLSENYNSFYGTNYQQVLFDAIDNMTPEYVQSLAKYYLTQPYLMTISGNKEIIQTNKNYLSKLGEIIF